MNRLRRGTVLIVVAGIAAMLAAVLMTFLARIRGESAKSRLLVQEAQARVMLNASLCYIQEASRLGWTSEGYGWTDVRDGSLGPRGPVHTDGSLPQPTWWLPAYGAYPPGPTFPATVSRASLRWPAPGSAMRGDLFAWRRAPYALELTYAYTPVPFDPAMLTVTDRKSYLRNAYAAVGAKGALVPQPLASTWSGFRVGATETSGAPVVVPGSDGLGWFRVYRETPAERDNDGTPWYDRVAFPTTGSHATFIVTCGAGGSRGFRYWSLPNADARAVEPVTAQESGLFVDQAMFDDLLRDARILWYRVEWSGATGANFDPGVYFDNGGQYRIRSAQRLHVNEKDQMPRQLNGNNPLNQTGTIKWIQRLDREPPQW